MLISTEGIVLKQRKISNNRRMITLFTKNYGKISAGTSMNEKGKGKSALVLRPFTYANYEMFKGRDTYNINSASVKKSFYSIGEDLDRFTTASKLIEYLDKMLEDEQPKPKLFDMTIEFFECITKSNSSYETLLYAFIFKTLRMQGVMPEIAHCVNCGKEIGNFGYEIGEGTRSHLFSIADGGVICEECSLIENDTSNKLIYKPSFDIIGTIKYFVNNPLEKFERVRLKTEISNEIEEILSKYVDYYLGINLRENDIKWR